MDLSTYYSQFRDEAVEQVRLMGAGLVALETPDLAPDARRTQIDAIFRAMHTIKGSARMLGFDGASKVAHTCEHILGAVREGRRQLDRTLADELLRGGDSILELINAQIEGRQASVDADHLTLTLGRTGRTVAEAEPTTAKNAPLANALAPLVGEVPSFETAPPPPPAATEAPATIQPRAPVSSPPSRQTVRVRVDRLDKLLDLTGELAVGRQIDFAHLEMLTALEQLVTRQQQALMSLDRELRRLRFSPTQRATIDERLNNAMNLGEQAFRLLATQVERFEQHVNQSRNLVDDLEQEVIAVRLLPVSALYANLPRAVRDLAKQSGKEIQLVLEGETTELDRKVIEALTDPLIHMVRNAVDHGIEPPEEREQLGKTRQGTIKVSTRSVGAYAQITISDDGRGMDPNRLRQSAVRKRLISTESAEQLTDHEALDLIFLPGFSTAQMITDISGRGVGMDVVRTNVLEIGGQVQVDSQIGTGTTLTLALPLTLVTTRVLLVELGRQQFALPATGLRGVVWADPLEVRTVEGRAVLPHEGRLVPLIRLADVLDVGGALAFPARRRAPCLLIGSTQRPLALVIDRLIDEREVVVKPLGPLLENQRRFSGAVQLGDGQLVLLLNPTVLAQTAVGMALPTASSHRQESQRARLLVVDDSFTTRELIRSILHAAGYDIVTAVDGVDALERIGEDRYDLVVTDVEMPRLDGFDLTMQIRQKLGSAAPPIMIITSLASEAHRRRGLEVGAQAYIVKSQFNQGSLLETVQQLLGD